MSSVLVANSYFYKLDSKQWKFKQPYPPLGTIQAASIIRNAGFNVSLFDTNLINDPSEIQSPLENTKPKYLVIYDDGFNYLTKMCLTVMRESAFVMINLGRLNNCKVIVCSSDSSDHYEKYLNQGADFVIKGEGDEIVKELIQALENQSDLTSIPNIIYKNDETLTINPQKSVLKDLDSLPLPAWDLIDVDAYRKIWLEQHGYFSLNIATTRGCPYKCNWCAKPIYGNRYNSRSPEHVANEIGFLINEFKVDHFWMCDDIFGLKPGWVEEFNQIINNRNLKFRYKIQSRVDLLSNEKTIEALAKSGAETVWVGAESGSQKILDAMDKGTSIEQIHNATTFLKKNNIRIGFFLQFGYLGETKEDIDKTLKMVLELMPDEIGVSVSYPLPGTKFYETVKSELSSKQNWEDSDDLALMFSNTYQSKYYKVLHRYIHNRYRIQRGLNLIKSPAITGVKFFRNIASMIYNIPLAIFNGLKLQRLSTNQ